MKTKKLRLNSLIEELTQVVKTFALLVDFKPGKDRVADLCFPVGLVNLCTHFGTNPWTLLDQLYPIKKTTRKKRGRPPGKKK